MPAADPETRFHFTEVSIRDWKPPLAGRVRLKDAGCPGLCLYVSPEVKDGSGKIRNHPKVFYFYAKASGRPVDIRLGVWPTLTVEEARNKARTEVAPDPGAVQKANRTKRQAVTLSDAWAALLAAPYRQRDGATLRPGTLASYQEAWKLLAPLHGRKVDQCDHGEVQALRQKMEKVHGPSSTRRALALLSLLLPDGLPQDPSPSHQRRTMLPKVQPRTRFLEGWELSALLRGLDAEPPIWRLFWICALIAPLSRGNLAKARWSELRLTEPGRETWEVPADRAQGGQPLHLPIAAPLANLLRDWRRQVPRAKYVFPASETASVKEGSTHIVNPLHAWRRALLLGSAWRMSEAIAATQGCEVRDVWTAFRADLEAERVASWSHRGRPGAGSRIGEGKPLDRSVARLADRCRKLQLDPDGMLLRNMKPHDLRRTAKSWAVQGGASTAMVAAALGHGDQRVTQPHDGPLADAPLRDLMNRNAGKILGMMGTMPEVSPIHPGGWSDTAHHSP